MTTNPTNPTPTPLPKCWQNVEDALNCGIDRLILLGVPGLGKTYGALTLGNTSAGAFRLVCNEDMTDANITGHYKPGANGQWKWQEGSAIKAWQGDGITGGRLVADEINRASGESEALLLAMFDSPESASWEHPDTGRVIRPLPGFSVIMTTNLEDPNDLPVALKDRFPVAITINEPHPNALLALPVDLREPARKFASADKDRRFSLRAFQAFAKLRAGMPLEQASEMIFGKHAPAVLDAMRIEALS